MRRGSCDSSDIAGNDSASITSEQAHNLVFTTAAYDEHKSIELLAFEITERISNSKASKDNSLSAIGFLCLCSAKLADIGFSKNKEKDDSGILGSPHQTQSPRQTLSKHQRSPRQESNKKYENQEWVEQEDRLLFWLPLLAGNKI
ncbi:hypothetical protein Tco_0868034 [Tanacetum coccineum]